MIPITGLASVIYNGVPLLPKLDSTLFRVTPKLSTLQFYHLPSSSLVGWRCRRANYSPIACSRGTEQEEGISNSVLVNFSEYDILLKCISEGDRSSSQSPESIRNVESSYFTPSSSPKEKKSAPENYASSIRTVALCVSTAVAFGVGLGFKDGVGKASEFFAGYLLEQSLSVDNLFVFVLIFKYFKVPLSYQNRVLSYGIAGAIVFRLSIILLGSVTLQRFEAVNLVLAAILLYSSFKLFGSEEEDSDLSDNVIVKTCQKFIPVTSNYDGNRFITLQDGVWKATPLLLTVAVIELSDIAFAVDSIPAVFGVTRDPFIVFTSNLFAILGLRSLYTLISEGMADLEYLQPSIGVVLGFIGCKMILDFFGYHVSTEVSLGVVATTLTAGVLLSLMKKSDEN
ncbi:thylakoid membrane protein TERC, chloroplastic isoform X1 [Rhododendron vialii]|uniref:thylakoid membrane protein TERC, chloroplastic isoform X1 n=1 Tax=Rhododendron vialii TaxID=182163 RepID=UPI00265E262D|nr:thylakoid membrane protein TERC, chloroplastic isoform X1 [Rhododendron vialii]